jgi:hypothetical protein
MRVLRIPAKHQATWRERPGLQAARYNCAKTAHIVLHKQGFPARLVSLLSARSPNAPRRCAWAGFAEKRCRLWSNGKLVFNIRISTEDEINGTVKGDV